MSNMNVFRAGTQLIVLVGDGMAFDTAVKKVTADFNLTSSDVAGIVAEYHADTARIAAIDWEHCDDYVAQEWRGLVAGRVEASR